MQHDPRDDESVASSLTSLFHDLLGDEKAKEIAAQDFVISDTRRLGTPFISRQQRETTRDEVKRFSICFYRRLSEQAAVHALKAWGRHNKDLENRLVSAMRTHAPIWHVVVDSIDYPGRQITVSKYFMQNLDSLRDLARECLIEFLQDDAPDELLQAIRNPQFEAWSRQWYFQSEDVNDDRSVKFICRLPGCNVLKHCIANNLPECCRLLLSQFSDITAEQRWQVLAEPLRYSAGRWQNNAFHEAAYCGSVACLEALICYADDHGLEWKQVVDGNGQTALDIAQRRLQKPEPGILQCVELLSREYGQDGQGGDARQEGTEAFPDTLLLVDVVPAEGETDRRRYALPGEATTWAELVAISHNALNELPRDGEHGRGLSVLVMVCKATVMEPSDEAIREFFRLWSSATSIGFSKCRFAGLRTGISVLAIVADCLESAAPPAWDRLYVSEAIAGYARIEGIEDAGRESATELEAAQLELAEQVRRLCCILSTDVTLPLWRIESLPAFLLAANDRHLTQLLGAALDVKRCIHQLREGKHLYRFFWGCLIHVERRMLNRMQLLADVNGQIAEALDRNAGAYLAACVRCWLASICGGEDSGNLMHLVEHGAVDQAQHATILKELDCAITAALLMCQAVPNLEASIRATLTPERLRSFPITSQTLAAAEGAANPNTAVEEAAFAVLGATGRQLRQRPAATVAAGALTGFTGHSLRPEWQTAPTRR